MFTEQKRIPLNKRMTIFSDLVTHQDKGDSVYESRRQICLKYSITESIVKMIERDGITGKWPPLDTAKPAKAS